ncbi:hypothetical protein K435DRAFT_851730 [Dendrothele bispora CBS 962.96]|uniref:Uncharacterized protein n=1 Tax=Dendrothele bispora (strain CBS 962.96) TaxID=1314807 RepID=A0A4S8MLU7_DENBC|nr:hypothetical protein K435DRAFT_851730 [Dendrothele bispora CBS 962.96]
MAAQPVVTAAVALQLVARATIKISVKTWGQLSNRQPKSKKSYHFYMNQGYSTTAYAITESQLQFNSSVSNLNLQIPSQSELYLSIQVLTMAMPILAALYPIFVLVVVAIQNGKPNATDDMTLSQSILFASSVANTQNDISIVESQSRRENGSVDGAEEV